MIIHDPEWPWHDYCIICKFWRHGRWFRKFTIGFRPIKKELESWMYNNKQLSPEEEVNSGGYIYRDAKRLGVYLTLFTDAEGDSCFSIYQIRWIKKCCFNFFFWNFRETTRHFSLRSRNSEYPRIFRVTGANPSARKLLSNDLVNTNQNYLRPPIHNT